MLSFMTAPYQNTTMEDSREFITTNGNDALYEKTHLVEKFHPGGYDDMDIFDFDTHEKLEMDSVTSTHATIVNRMTAMPSHISSVNPSPEGNRKGNERAKHGNRQNGKGSRKNTNRKDSGVNAGEAQRTNGSRKEKGGRRVDDVDEKLELKPNKKFDFDKFGEFEVSTVFEAPKNGRKQSDNNAKMIDGAEENPSEVDDENRKNSVKDGNVHGIRRPETIASLPTDSKIIEIKPTIGRNGVKKIKRYSGDQQETDQGESDFGVQIEAASLIGAVPANLSGAGATNLSGIAGSIQRYLHVQKEIGNYAAGCGRRKTPSTILNNPLSLSLFISFQTLRNGLTCRAWNS